MNAIRKIGGWYWGGLKKMPVFSAGYVVGCIVTAVFLTSIKLAYAVMAMAP